jgi:hypothetical protein
MMKKARHAQSAMVQVAQSAMAMNIEIVLMTMLEVWNVKVLFAKQKR